MLCLFDNREFYFIETFDSSVHKDCSKRFLFLPIYRRLFQQVHLCVARRNNDNTRKIWPLPHTFFEFILFLNGIPIKQLSGGE